ncbi:MAG: glycosyltransferase [Sphaerochaetaceae bacterium]|nr:glycosyltransferase [Sphaerochaetaceae bacterium]
MNIAFGFDIFYPETNGVITASINLATNLINMGHNVYFFVPNDKGFTEDTIENGIKVIHVPAINTFVYPGIKLSPYHSRFLLKYLLEFKIDVVHTTSTWLVCLALAHAAKRLGLPVVSTHHTLIDNPDYIQYALKNRKLSVAAQHVVWTTMFSPFYKWVDVITAPSNNTCRQLRKHLPSTDIRFISNGIDISRFQSREAACPIPRCIPETFVNRNALVYVGRQGYEKSIDVLLKGFSILKERMREARLLVVGKGPAAEELKELAKALGLTEDDVCFTGLIPNAELIGSLVLTKLGAFVSASLTENQAMTIIEALCSGCPVIVPDQANMTDLVTDESGWIFIPKDERDLAVKMYDALSDKENQRRKGLAAKQNINRFDGVQISKQFLKLYEEFVEKHAAKRERLEDYSDSYQRHSLYSD